eukprot:XP_001694930.1 predicted protein [Chlamydomonas reinhardtii]
MDPQQQLEDAGEPGWAKGAESYRGERRAFKRVKCVAHVFGRDIMYDLALAQAIDVLVATHGAAGYHSFFMSRGASFVEVMPFHFTPQWANIYYARMLENDKKVIWVSGRGQFGQLSGVSGLKCGMQSGYLDATNA